MRRAALLAMAVVGCQPSPRLWWEEAGGGGARAAATSTSTYGGGGNAGNGGSEGAGAGAVGAGGAGASGGMAAAGGAAGAGGAPPGTGGTGGMLGAGGGDVCMGDNRIDCAHDADAGHACVDTCAAMGLVDYCIRYDCPGRDPNQQIFHCVCGTCRAQACEMLCQSKFFSGGGCPNPDCCQCYADQRCH